MAAVTPRSDGSGSRGRWVVAASRSRRVRAVAQCVAVTAPGLLQLHSGATRPNGSLGVPGDPHTALIALVPPVPGPCPSAVPGLCDNPTGAGHTAGARR